jgi:hypothetical protein
VGEAGPVAAGALKKQLAGGSFQTVNQMAQESIREQVREVVAAGDGVNWHAVVVLG